MVLKIPRNNMWAIRTDKGRQNQTRRYRSYNRDRKGSHNIWRRTCFGGGKSIRDGMGQASGIKSKYSLDLVITNTILMDPLLGIVKTDIGIKNGLILGIGKAGNPNVMEGSI